MRPYQEEMARRVLESKSDDIVCLPTGGGKTVIAGEIIDRLSDAGETVVFVVPRLELIDQADKEFEDCDFIWSDRTVLTGKKKIIASKDSLRSQCGKLPEGIVMIIDECHISLKQSKLLVDRIKPKRVIGLTATPERMDGLALVKGKNGRLAKWACWDSVIQTESVASLIDKGYLSKLRYYTKPIEGITEMKSDSATAEELSGEQMEDIFDKNQIWGDIVDCYEKYALRDGKRRPALGFTTTVEMAERVAALFAERGHRFEVISGNMSVDLRKSLIDALANGEIDGLVNAQLLTYGFDCPPVSYAFSCRHVKSRPFWFQMVGRILRVSEGKEDAIFIDHGDSISEFAEPDCSLPILDPCIKWRSEGETKEQKAERKKRMRNVRETMKELQSLDPIECALVEVTNEDTWQRMIRIIRRQREENERLKELNDELSNARANQVSLIQQQRYENERLRAQNDALKKEGESQTQKLRQELQKEKTEKEKLKKIVGGESKKAKITGPKNCVAVDYPPDDRREEDKNGTFEFVRINYKKIRYSVRESLKGEKLEHGEKMKKEHELTVKRLMSLAPNLSFRLVEWQLNRSLDWWQYEYNKW